jgi:hypothetical protein
MLKSLPSSIITVFHANCVVFLQHTDRGEFDCSFVMAIHSGFVQPGIYLRAKSVSAGWILQSASCLQYVECVYSPVWYSGNFVPYGGIKRLSPETHRNHIPACTISNINASK